MARTPAPTLVERALVLESDRPDPERLEQLVAFQRRGQRVLMVAPKPRRWRPTRNSVDRDLGLQQKLHHLIRRAGGELDGVVYLGTGLFSRRQSQKRELATLARRYGGRKISELVMIAADRELLEAMQDCGGQVLAIGDEGPNEARRFDNLGNALASLG